MNKKELEFILQEGEGFKIEFKENIKGLDKEIVAFANAEGGRIFIGINDDCKIKHINITNRLKSQIQDIANNCDPSVKINLKGFNGLLIINVSEGADKPYRCSSGFYLRQGANSQKMTRNEIINFAVGEGKIKFDEQINTRFDFKNDFDENKLDTFLEKADIKTTLPKREILINFGVAIKKEGVTYLNNTGILFFAKNLKKFFPQAYTTCVRYKGNTRTNIIDRVDLEGDLVEQVEEAIKFLLKNTRLAYKFTGKPAREEVPEYPTEVIREGIINAIMHRDYFEKGSNVYLNIYSDRIEIINPGGLFKITRKEFGKRASRRNEHIANLFHRIEFGEKLGSGIKRMDELMVRHGLSKPRFDISKNFFEVDFFGPGESVLEGEVNLSKLNTRQRKTVMHLKKHNSISIAQYISLNKVSDKTARRDLGDLLKKGIIIKEGVTTNLIFKLRSTSVNFGQLRSKET